MRAAHALTLVSCLCVLLSACGDAGSQGKQGSSCSMQTSSDGSVRITCDDGTGATLKPPTSAQVDAGDAEPCRFERTEQRVFIQCPDGSSASLPVALPESDAGPVLDAAGSEACQVQELTPGELTITCPDGSSAQLPVAPSEPRTTTRRVGASATACGGCHDGAAARAHFKVMSYDLDAGVRESCGTCHAETGIRPVSEAHARPELSGPGLNVQLEAASIDALTRRITAQLRLTDRTGAPITSTGVELEWWIAQVGSLDSVDETTTFAGPYENYLLETATQQNHPDYPLGDAVPRVVEQPRTEQGTGTLSVVHPGADDGRYAYQFSFVLPEGYAADRTHVIGVMGARSVADTRFVDDATYFFVPNTPAAPVSRRESVRTESCQTCHAQFRAHDAAISDVQVCLGCHTQGAIDPETNHSLDFNRMIHRIHRGRDLPSVKAGTPYGFVNEHGSFVDFSRVGYPQPIANCQGCHTDADDERWVRNGSRAVCTSCHEQIDLPWEQGGHPFALEPDQNCSNGNCHGVSGRVRDAREAHLTVLNDPKSLVFKLEIVSVAVAAADAAIAVRARGRVGKRSTAESAYTPLTSLSQLDRLDVFINGPTEGYLKDGNTLKHYAREQLIELTLDPARPGELTFRLPESFSASVASMGDLARDSFSLSLGAAYDPSPGAAPDNDRVGAQAQPVQAISLSETLVPRREVVTTQSCNVCHGALRHHTGASFASTVEQCALCHTAGLDTRVRQAAQQVNGPTQSLRLSQLVHRVHGAKIATEPYRVFGDPTNLGSLSYPLRDLSELPYSGDVRDCGKCHSLGTNQLPVSDLEPATITTVLGVR